MMLFDRTWSAQPDGLRCGEAHINLLTRRAQVTPRGAYYSTRSKSGLLAFELELRAAQDDEGALAAWLTAQGYLVEYGPAATVISQSQDAHGAYPVVRGSGLTLADAARDYAARL